MGIYLTDNDTIVKLRNILWSCSKLNSWCHPNMVTTESISP